MEKNTIISIIRGVNPDHIIEIMKGLLENGISWAEVSLSEEQKGLECIRRISKSFSNQVSLGVGTVVNKRQVDAAIDAGAKYIITPGWDRNLVEYVISKDVEIFPGVFSPGEVMQAKSLGIKTVKVFPVNSLPMDYVKNLKGPFPSINYMAVGGVTKNNIISLKKAGYSSFAIGSELVPRGATKENIERIIEDTREFKKLIDLE